MDRVIGFILWLLLAVVVVSRLEWILGIEHIPSTDGYYYLKEIENYARDGHGYYTAFSPYLWLLGTVSRIFGLSAIATFHLAIAASLGLLSIAFVHRGLSYALPCLLIGLWSSDILFYRHYGFPKQATSIGFFACACRLWVTLPAAGERRIVGRSIYLGSLACTLALAACTHIFGAVSVAGLGVVQVTLTTRHIEKSQWSSLKFFGPIVLTALLLGAIGVYLQYNPKELFLWSENLTCGWLAACQVIVCSNLEHLEFVSFAIIGAACAMTALHALRRSRNPDHRTWEIILYLGAAVLAMQSPIWEIDGHMTVRLAFSSVWFLYLMAGLLLQVKESAYPKARQFVCAVLIVPLLMKNVFESKKYEVPYYPVASLAKSRETLQTLIPPNAFIVAPHGFQFAITYFLNRRSAQAIPEGAPPKELYEVRRTGRHSSCLSPDCIRLDSQWCIFSGGSTQTHSHRQ